MFLKDGLARSWAEYLSEVTGGAVYPGRRAARAALPFSVVVVKRLAPISPGVNVHRADVRIVHVSDAVDSTTEAHQARVRALYAAIENTPRPAVDPESGVELLGFMVTEIEQVEGTGDDGRKVMSDVFLIDAGAAGPW
jgi:hypothetical protein